MIQKVRSKQNFSPSNSKLKITIVKSLYYESLTSSMELSATKTLVSSGVLRGNIKTFSVPGSWELPLLVDKIAQLKRFDGILVFGVIIKGETYHFELIARECARALMDLSIKYSIPVTFEVLVTSNIKQAKKRATGENNEGIEAANTVLQTIQSLRNLLE